MQVITHTDPRICFKTYVHSRKRHSPTAHKSYKSGENSCVCVSATTPNPSTQAAVAGEFVWSPSVRKHLPRTRIASPRPPAQTNRNQFPGYGGRINHISSPLTSDMYTYILGHRVGGMWTARLGGPTRGRLAEPLNT